MSLVAEILAEVHVGRLLRQQQAAQAQYDRLSKAFKPNQEWVPHQWEWQDKQTDKAIHFPTHGWVPKSAVAWKHKTTGEIRGWHNGPASGDAHNYDFM